MIRTVLLAAAAIVGVGGAAGAVPMTCKDYNKPNIFDICLANWKAACDFFHVHAESHAAASELVNTSDEARRLRDMRNPPISGHGVTKMNAFQLILTEAGAATAVVNPKTCFETGDGEHRFYLAGIWFNLKTSRSSNSEECSETADGVTRESEGGSRLSVLHPVRQAQP
jgi:hypothetical protein